MARPRVREPGDFLRHEAGAREQVVERAVVRLIEVLQISATTTPE